MIERPVDQIDERDLQALVTRAQAEGRRLDYKLELPGTSERAVKEFLADVTSFANTDGGDIILGLSEDGNGVAAEVTGVPSATIDQDILRIEEQVRNCVDPRLPTFRIHPVGLANGSTALVLRIPASIVAPHRVTYRGSSRFFARNSRGKYEMDTAELRAAFAATEGISRKLHDLHAHAIAAIGGDNMPCKLADAPALVLTVAPLSILREPRDLNVTRENVVLPPNVSGGIHMITGLQGIVVFADSGDKPLEARAWTVNHRRGYVDQAWSIGRERDGRKIIWRRYVDEALLSAVRSSVARLRGHSVEGPWVAMATLVGIRGFSVLTGDDYMTQPAWQDPAYLGEVLDDTLDQPSLQPFLDGFWRVFGVDQAPPVNTR